MSITSVVQNDVIFVNRTPNLSAVPPRLSAYNCYSTGCHMSLSHYVLVLVCKNNRFMLTLGDNGDSHQWDASITPYPSSPRASLNRAGCSCSFYATEKGKVSYRTGSWKFGTQRDDGTGFPGRVFSCLMK